MSDQLIRVGTIYIPVSDVDRAAEWYARNIGAEISYKDQLKAILNFANQSFFLVKSKENQRSSFSDMNGKEHFSMTFEVNGLKALQNIHDSFVEKGIKVSEIEDRGHAGKNFVFYDLDDNQFDVWSELSPIFKKNYKID